MTRAARPNDIGVLVGVGNGVAVGALMVTPTWSALGSGVSVGELRVLRMAGTRVTPICPLGASLQLASHNTAPVAIKIRLMRAGVVENRCNLSHIVEVLQDYSDRIGVVTNFSRANMLLRSQ